MDSNALLKKDVSLHINVPRHEKILNIVNQKGNLSISSLAKTLNVTEQTIRRDIRKLEEMNLLSRYHGGVIKVQETELVNKDFAEREQTYVKEKEAIAKEVVKIIPEGSTVFITIGTTVEKIASVLVEKSALRVITDSLRVASILYRNPNIEVIVPAGSIRHTNGGIEGPKAIADLGEYRADFAITSIGAIDQDGTLLDFNLSEVIAAKTMISNAKQLIIACDHSKFTAAASIRLGHLKQASYLVTDIRPKEEIMSIVEDNHIVLVNPEIDI